MYLLVTSSNDHDDGWTFLSLIRMSDKEAALKYKKKKRTRRSEYLCRSIRSEQN